MKLQQCSAGALRRTRGRRDNALAIAALLGPAAWAALSVGCVKKPFPKDACTRPDLGGCIVDEIDFIGAQQVDAAEIEGRIATAETSRTLGGALEHVPLLGVWDTLNVEYELFDRFVLERDLARIERFYRARGFYEAHARAGRVIKLPDKKVRVEIVVDEGPPVDQIKVNLAWKDPDAQVGPGLENKEEAIHAVRTAVQNAKNDLERRPRFDEEDYDGDAGIKKKIRRALTANGFAYGDVTGQVFIDLTTHAATVSLVVDFGPYCHFGEIKIAGLGEIPEDKVRDAIDIEPGSDYSSDKLEDAEFALAALNVFGAIEITPQLSPEGQPESPVVPVLFTVQPAALRLIKLGVGAELAGDRSDVHLLAGWENRNFLGGLRKLNVELRPGLAFYPTTLTDPTLQAVLPEVKARVDLQQPGFIEARTTGILGCSFALFQYRTAKDDACAAAAEENIIGYRELTGRAGVERKFWLNRHTLGLFANVQFDTPFSYTADAPPEGFRSVLIPYAELNAALDLRRGANNRPDQINPNKGLYLNANVQYADIGDAQDVRFQPEIRGYLPISKKVTLAVRLSTGFLFAPDYADQLDSGVIANDPAAEAERQAELASDLQLLSFRGFFSGGANSNRGYGYRGVGPHRALNSIFQELPENSECRIPTGGLTLWETSLELRVPISGALRAALFGDASDVTTNFGALRLDHPHLSAGVGLRYDTPVGPLRADVGYRIPCMQEVGNCGELPADEGNPGDVFGIPIAVSVAIGEAF